MLEDRRLLSATGDYDPYFTGGTGGGSATVTSTSAIFFNPATSSYTTPGSGVNGVFGGMAGAAAISGAVAFNSITVYTDGYSFTSATGGGALNLPANAQISIATGATATFTVAFATGGLYFTGGGTAVLSAANSYAAGTQVQNATVIATTPGAIPDGTDVTVGDATPFAAGPPPRPRRASSASGLGWPAPPTNRRTFRRRREYNIPTARPFCPPATWAPALGPRATTAAKCWVTEPSWDRGGSSRRQDPI